MRRAFVLLSVLLMPAVAHASSFTADFLRVGNAQVVNTVKNGTSKSVWAGELIWNGTAGSPEPFGDDFFTYCVDLTTVLVDPQSFTVRSTDHFVPDGSLVAWLVNTYAPSIHAVSGSLANARAAGLQLAIWNVLYDNDFSVSNYAGSFWSTTSSAVVFANDYLASLNGAMTGGQPLGAHAVWLDTAKGQDQVAVPGPSALLVAGLGLLFAARSRRFAVAPVGWRCVKIVCRLDESLPANRLSARLDRVPWDFSRDLARLRWHADGSVCRLPRAIPPDLKMILTRLRSVARFCFDLLTHPF